MEISTALPDFVAAANAGARRAERANAFRFGFMWKLSKADCTEPTDTYCDHDTGECYTMDIDGEFKTLADVVKEMRP